MKNKSLFFVIALCMLCLSSYSQDTKSLTIGKKQHVIVDNKAPDQRIPVTVENTKPVPVSLERAVPLNVKVENTVPVSIQSTTPINVTVTNPGTTPAAKQPYPFRRKSNGFDVLDFKTDGNRYVIEYITCSETAELTLQENGNETTYSVPTNKRVMILLASNRDIRINCSKQIIVNGMVYPQ